MALCVYFEHRFGIGKVLHSVEVALHDEAERVSVVKGVCFVVAAAAAAGRELLELSRSRECGRGDSDGKTTII